MPACGYSLLSALLGHETVKAAEGASHSMLEYADDGAVSCGSTPLRRTRHAPARSRRCCRNPGICRDPGPCWPRGRYGQGSNRSIARGEVGALVGAYGPSATLHWVGGPLDGTYSSSDKLKEAWTKFTGAQGSDQKAKIAAISEAANPKGATVTADVVFAGKNTVKVRYVLLYREGKLADEVWQVNPT